MLIRKFNRATLESEPEHVLFRDIYPWDAIEETPFGASLAVIEGGGQTMVHSHHPAETFVICQGQGTMTIGEETSAVSAGDVIYLPPQSVHNLKNDSATDSLMFLSVFWDAPGPAPEVVEETPESTTRLLFPSPPTPNGGLHLGHLAGPYLLADVARRYDRLSGRASQFVLVNDDHQSYVTLRARFDGRSEPETALHYGEKIVALLKAFDADPDRVVHPHRDETYQEAVKAALGQLFDGGFLVTREVDELYCKTCDLSLYDGHLAGGCPHCECDCRGFLCETCCMPNQGTDLLAPHCLHCEETPEKRTSRRLFFSFQPFRERLASYHGSLRMTPRLRGLSARLLALEEFEAIVSQPASWGIPVGREGFEGQCISPWFELALAAPHLRGAHAEVVHCFGYDNAYLYLLHDPAVALALDPQAVLPSALSPNEYLLLDDSKMSTRSGHNLGAEEILSHYPSDLVRLYLASFRPEEMDVSCSLAHMQQFLEQRVIQPWQNWLERLGRALTSESGSKAPGVGGWTPEQEEFMGHLQGLLNRIRRGYETFSLQEVTRAVFELVDRGQAFGLTQSHLVNIPSLLVERHSALAIELAAVRLLAEAVAPIMPKFSATLWKHLGFRAAQGLSAQVQLVPPGQRVLAAAGLVSRRYFPASLTLTPA